LKTLTFFLGVGTSVLLSASCGSSSNLASSDAGTADGVSSSSSGGSSGGETGDGSASDAHPVTDSGGATTDSGMVPGDGTATCGTCPSGYTCGTANGLPVCRAPSGIPLFSNVYVILMENTSLSTLNTAMTGGTAPNLAALGKKYATAAQYHGVAHPSLPNYVALTSGSVQGIGCDCEAQSGAGTCSALNCNLLAGTCSCQVSAMNLADQLEAANLTWRDFGEAMNTPCNVVDSGNYAVRHNPFLYYADIQGNATRCDTHVVDFAGFNPASPDVFNYIAPNLIDDMHNPDPTNSTNIPDGDMWIGPHVASILSSSAYEEGGLLVVVWDEDDDSGGITGTDDPIPIFVMSPYAKSNGYISATMANHYSLLATFEDGLGLGRLGSAAMATPLADFFPAQ
jgi:phosphatidylinositol-3-phosphatase